MVAKILFKCLIVVALLGHTVLTVQSFVDHGYAGYFPPFTDANTTQIFSDLVIALSLVNVWVFYDLRQRGVGMGWGVLHLVGSALLGSYAPMVYLLVRPLNERMPPSKGP